MVKEIKQQRKTAGQASIDLLQEDPKEQDIYEIREVALADYTKKVENCINEGTTKYIDDFYVVVEAKRERLMPNVLRNFIFSRASCPTPHYGQTVYHFNKKTSEIAFLWIVPDKDICKHIYENMLLIPEYERDLLKCVMDFYDGTLLRQAQLLNRENQITSDIYA